MPRTYAAPTPGGGNVSHGRFVLNFSVFPRPRPVNPRGATSKQVRVRPRALKDDGVALELVDEQPVGFDVALPPPLERAHELVIAACRVKRSAANERANDGLTAAPS